MSGSSELCCNKFKCYQCYDRLATEYRLLRVPYLSYKTQKYETDLIRCSPSCYDRERFDYVMYNDPRYPDETKPSFGRLVLVFSLKSCDPQATQDRSQYDPIAMIQDFKFLGRQEPTYLPQLEKTSNTHFIYVKDIIRAVSLPPVPLTNINKKNETVAQLSSTHHYLNEFIDCDMYHRINHIFPVETSLADSFFTKLKLDIEEHRNEPPAHPDIGATVDQDGDIVEEEFGSRAESGRAGADENGVEDLIEDLAIDGAEGGTELR